MSDSARGAMSMPEQQRNLVSLSRRRKRKQQMLSEQQRASSSELTKHRQLLMENPAPFVTASAWIIIDEGAKGEMMFGKNEHDSR